MDSNFRRPSLGLVAKLPASGCFYNSNSSTRLDFAPSLGYLLLLDGELLVVVAAAVSLTDVKIIYLTRGNKKTTLRETSVTGLMSIQPVGQSAVILI